MRSISLSISAILLWITSFANAVDLTSVDIDTQLTGSFTDNGNGSYTIQGSGGDIWNSSDQFRYSYTQWSGDFDVRCRIADLQVTDSWSKAGIMLRASTDGNSIHSSIFVTGQNGFAMQGRNATGGDSYHIGAGANNPPGSWIRLERVSNVVTGMVSDDGIVWRRVQSINWNAGANALLGLAVTSHNSGLLCQAEFRDVAFGLPQGPVNGFESIDINTGIEGCTTAAGPDGFDVTGSGSDIWNTQDSFRMVYKSFTGNFDIRARVAALDLTDPWSKAGVTVRDSTDPGSINAAMLVSGSNGFDFQHRDEFNGSSTYTAAGSNSLPNSWVRLIRAGNTITGYKSSDNINWLRVDSVEWHGGNTALVGMAVTAHNWWALCNAQFRNVSLQGYSPPASSNGTGLSATYRNSTDISAPVVFTRVDPQVRFNWTGTSPDQSITPGNFAVRWLGQIEPQFSEPYTFYLRVDDGARLWIGGQLVINAWFDQAPTIYSGTINLNAGQKYDIRMEYFEDLGGEAVAELLWSSPSTPMDFVPQSQLFPTGNSMFFGNGTGLAASYFSSMDTGGTATLTRIDPQLDFNWNDGSPAPSIPVDHFAARWTGQVQSQFSETYTFYIRGDDGVRMWLNGQLVVDQWHDQGPTEYSAQLAMSAGTKYDIMIEYYENGGGALCELRWESPQTFKEFIPQSQLYPTGMSTLFGNGTGLQGYYYTVRDLSTTPTVTQVDPTINFDWGGGGPIPGIVDNFSIRWLGQVQPQYSEPYTFYVRADDGVRLWVDHQLLIDQWGDQAPAEYSTTLNVQAGRKYDIQIEYYEHGGGAVMQLFWSSARTPKRIIPQSQLYPTMTNPPHYGNGNGLAGSYFNNMTLSEPAVLSRIDKSVDFDWEFGSPGSPVQVDNFSARWEGSIEPLTTETYTFYVRVDDGARLWVNNQLLVNQWHDQPPTEYHGTINLTAGVRVPIRLEFYENGGGAVAELSWSTPTFPKAIVPQTQLYSVLVNRPPYIVQAASANPSPSTGNTTNLSVLGADAEGGEGSLIYTWSSPGTPNPSPTFSINGSNVAKNTVATVQKAGTYTFTVTIKDSGNLTVKSTVNVTFITTLTTISLTPTNPTIKAGGTQQFNAKARDQFGKNLNPQPSFTWSVSGGGTINSSGLFLSNGTAGVFTVTASSGGKSGSTQINVVSNNTPPKIVTAATASPNPVSGTTTNLSVAATDNGGEPSLLYTWSAVGPAAVNFSANGTNGAKNSVATFLTAGNYTLTVTVKDTGNLTTTSSVNVQVNQTPTSIAVSPSNGATSLNGVLQFTATEKDQFGHALVSQPAFSWTISGGGTIDASGLFSAGSAAGGPYTVTATSSGLSGTAHVTVSDTAPFIVNPASISPDPVTGTSAAISVLGGDDAIESTLNYHWEALGIPPAAVTFQDNDSNIAKNTTVNFAKAGNYTLRVTITDEAALSTNSSISFQVLQTPSSISVSPNGASTALNGTIQFSATSSDQFGNPLVTQPGSFNWSVSGGGTINSAGLFTAGQIPGGPFSVTAQSGNISGSASFSLTDAPPIVVEAASATPNPVTVTTTALHVLGGDDLLEPSLTYTWSVIGNSPGVVSFSANGDNASKDSTATFVKAGLYHLLVTITDTANLSVTSAVDVQVNSVLGDVLVTPKNAATAQNGSVTFNAVSLDQFGYPLASQPTITWSVSGGGTITASGVFTAQESLGDFTVTASAGAFFDTAIVSVTNQAPIIVTAASANPNPVTGLTSDLTVLGGDDAIEAELTYSWQVLSGPAAVSFSSNGTNASKHSTATFAKAGAYSLQVTVSDRSNLSVTSSVDISVLQTLTQIVVSPSSAGTPLNGTQQFSALQLDQFGAPMANQQASTWAVSGGGTINAGGFFTAGATAGGPFTITASLNGISGTASVTVNANAPFIEVAASATPNPVTGTSTHVSITAGDDAVENTFTYTWAAFGAPAGSVAFSPNGTNAAKSSTASFSHAGNYTLRVTVTNPSNLSATSSVDVLVTQVAQTIAVLPASATVSPGGTQQFNAIASDQFGDPISSVNWSVNGGGIINSAGLFTAGQTSGGPFIVTATRDGKSGTATVMIATFNSPPIANAQNVSTNEDTPKAITLTASDPDNDALSYTIVSFPQHGTLSGTVPSLTYSPGTDYFGADNFSFKVNDGHADSNIAQIAIAINPVNDAPSFVAGQNQNVANDSGPQSVAGWATAITAGPANEANQALNFILSNDNTALFSAQPFVQPNGTLQYTPAIGQLGTATVTIRLHDNGGIANGGVDTSAPQSFTITLSVPAGPIMTTTAGSDPFGGFGGDGGPPTSALMTFPSAVAISRATGSNGDLYIVDTYNVCIRKVDRLTDTITTFAGTPGVFGNSGDGGAATAATLGVGFSSGLAVDSAGNVFIADTDNTRIRKVNASDGNISTFASVVCNALVFDSSNNLYVSQGSQISKINTSGVVTLFAGTTTPGYSDGPALSAAFSDIQGLAMDSAGNLYVSDNGNSRIRKIAGNVVTTIAGNGSSDYSGDGGSALLAGLSPFGIAVDSSNSIYVADQFNHRIRKIDTGGTIATYAGNGVGGFNGDGGLAITQSLAFPTGVALDSGGAMYIADMYNMRIRRVGAEARPYPPASFNTTKANSAPNALSWTDLSPNPAKWFRIERKLGLNGTFAETAHVRGNIYSYTDNVAGANYYYRLRATNLAGDSDYAYESQIPTTVIVSPSQVAMKAGATQQFSALVLDQLGNPINSSVTWSATRGSGYIDSTGFYQAGNTSDPVTITATFETIFGNAEVTLIRPTANDQQIAVNEDSSVSVTLTAIPLNGETLVYSIFDNPSNGTLTGIPPNVTYVPNPDFNGSDSFTFVANDGVADSNRGRITIIVAPVNDAPVAHDDVYNLEAGIENVITPSHGILSNDTDVDGDTLSAIRVNDTAYGTLVLNSDGSFTYTPNVGFTGTDTFSYVVDDGTVTSANTATVTLIVSTQTTPAFSNVFPVNGSWINQARPIISGDISGIGIDPNSLTIELSRVIDDRSIPMAALNSEFTLNHFEAALPFDLEETTYEVAFSVTNLNGVEATALSRFSVDLTKPVVTGFPPASPTQSRRPVISASYTDALSGIDVSSVKLKIDLIEVPVTPTDITATSFTYTPPADLIYGSHNLQLIVGDVAGNKLISSATIVILDPNIDVQPPLISNVSPAPNAWVSCALAPPTAFKATFSDDMSGVDAGSVRLFIDDVLTPLPNGAATAAGLNFVIPATLDDGPHSWKLMVWDIAGNGPAVVESSFNADSTMPVMSGFIPNYDLVGPEPLTAFSGTIDDGEGSGIVWDSLVTKVNGVAFPSVLDNAHFSVNLPHPIDVPCTISVDVNDLAGNHLQYVKVLTPALSHFRYVNTGGTEVEIPTPNFSIPNRNSTNAVYLLRATVAPGVNSLVVTGTGNGLIGVNVIGSVATIQITSIDSNLNSKTLTFTAKDADGRPILFQGSIIFPSVVPTAPVISATPNGAAGPFTPISISVNGSASTSDFIKVAGVTISVDLEPPYSPVMSGIGNVVANGTVKPAKAYSKGHHTYTITAVNGAGLSTPLTQGFDVADIDPPTVTVNTSSFTAGFLNNSTLTFTVDDGLGYGVATDQTTLSYTVNGVTTVGIPSLIGQSTAFNGDTTYSYQFVFPAFVSGSNVSYLVSAEDLSDPVNVGHASGSFVVDNDGPVINNISPAPGTIPGALPGDPFPPVVNFTFDIRDGISGTGNYSAQLVDTTTGVSRGSLSGFGDGAGHYTTNTISRMLTPNDYLTQGHAFALLITASDQLNKNTTVIARYITVPEMSAPTIALTVNTTNRTVSGTIQDPESGIDASQITTNLNGTPLTVASMTVNNISTLVNIVWNLPADLNFNTNYPLTVTATNLTGWTNSASALVNIPKTLPPMPIANSIDQQPGIVTISGTIPNTPADLADIVASATFATTNSTRFDLATHEWSVTFAKQSGNFDYSIAYIDADAIQGPALTGTQNFAQGTVVPPLVQPVPGGIPAGSVAADTDNPPTVYWDFNPADIHAITKPRVSDYPYVSRGWIPATFLSTVRLTGFINGNNPPYQVSIEGSGFSVTDQHVSGSKVTATLSLNPDVLVKVRLVARDATGQAAPSMTRNIVLDKQLPLPTQFGLEWTWNYSPVYPPQTRAPSLFSALATNSSETIRDEQPPTGGFASGIERMTVTLGEGSAARTLLVCPKDFETDTYNTTHDVLDFYRSKQAWSANIPLLKPDGSLANMGDRIDFEPNGHVTINNVSYITYDPNIKIPMSIVASDASANLASLTGVLAGAQVSGMPQALAVNQAVLVTYDDLASDGEILYISVLVNGREMKMGRDHAYVLKFDSPGVYAYTLTQSHSAAQQGKIVVFDPYLRADENGDGNTADEDAERQYKYGVNLPINDDFETNAIDGDGHPIPDYKSTQNRQNDTSLRKVTFDKNLVGGQISFSSNLRLWADKNKSRELGTYRQGLGPFPTQRPFFDQYQFVANISGLNGEFYVECLPHSRQPALYNTLYYIYTGSPSGAPPGSPLFEHRFIEINASTDAGGQVVSRLNIHAVSDRNEGRREGEATVAADGPVSVDATSGAVKGVWPVARSASRIIPDIFLHYNSRDQISAELNPRLRPAVEVVDPYFAGDDYFQGECAPNFRHTLEMRIIRGGKVMHLISGDGRRVAFHPTSTLIRGDDDELGVTWVSEDRKGHFSTIQTVKQLHFDVDERAYYVLRQPKNNQQYVFEKSTGKLKEIRDVHNNTATLEYDEYGGTRGHLQRVVDNRGIFISFRSDGKGNMYVTDPAGRTTSIGKGGIIGPLGNYTFKLDGDGVMQSFTSVRGAPYLVNSSEGVANGVTRTADLRGMNFTYDFANKTAQTDHYATVNEPLRRYHYDYDNASGTWKKISFNDGQGNNLTVDQAASAKGLVSSRSNILGGTWPFAYDDSTGQQTSVTDPDGHHFSAAHEPVPNNRYAANGPNYLQNFLPTSQSVDGNTVPVNYGFNADGFLASVTDSFGQGRVTQWDAFGLPMSIVGPRPAYSKTIDYDDLGRVRLVTEQGGGMPTTMTSYRTDSLGRVREITLNDHRVIRRHYDKQGNLICTEGPLVTAEEHAKNIADGGSPSTFYEPGGQWILSIDANGNSVSRTVNSLGAVTSYTNSAGAVTYFSEFNALLLPKYTDMPPAVDGGPGRIVEHTYDSIGREIQRILPGKINNQPRIETIRYLLNGKIVEVTDPRGTLTTYTRLKSGRLQRIENLSTGSAVTMGYDGNGTGNASQSMGLAKSTRSFGQYDLINQFGVEGTSLQVSHSRDAEGEISKTTLPGQIDVFAPADSRGRVHKISVGGTTVAELLYEDPLRPTLQTSSLDLETGARVDQDLFDAYWRPKTSSTTIKSTSSFGPYPNGGTLGNLPIEQDVNIFFTRRNSGEVLNFTDGNGNTSHNLYNAAGWFTGSLDQNNLGGSTAFYQSGFIASKTDERNKSTQYFYYPDTGFLKALRFPDGKGVHFTHDLNGNVVEARYAMALDSGGDVVETPDPNLPPGLNVTPLRFTYIYDDQNRLISKKDPELHETTYEYYTSGLLARVTDPDGKSVRYVYDGAGRQTFIYSFPGGGTTAIVYADNGKVETLITPDRKATTYIYDNRGRVSQKSTTGEGTTQYGYTGADLTSIKDALGHNRYFLYDTAHRLLATFHPGTGTSSRQAYDPAGYVIATKDEAGHVFKSDNFENGRRHTLTLVNPNGETNGAPYNGNLLHTFTYDGNTPTNDGSVSWTLDDAGRIASCSSGCSYQYNHPMGLMTQKSYGGLSLNYQYDNAAYLYSVSDTAGNSLTFGERTAAGLPVQADYSNGVHVDWQYQYKQFVSQMKYTKAGTLISQWDAGYDSIGRRHYFAATTQDGQPPSEVTFYGYDAASRVSTEQRSLNGGAYIQTDYTYDAMGNRKTKTVDSGPNAGTESYTYGTRNELGRIDHANGEATILAYDFNGNTLSKYRYNQTAGAVETNDYTWDALNRLTSATKTANNTTNTASFNYDPFGWQLNSQTVNGETRSFTYGVDGELLSETVPGFGTRTYVNGSLDHTLWSIDSQGASPTKFWHTDINGSVFAIADSAGTVLERQRYDAFGNTEITDAAGVNVQGASGIGNRIGFHGRSSLSELGLQYFRNRFYDPQNGRWINRDPLGIGAGLNDYWAFSADSINIVDVMGLDPDDGPLVGGPLATIINWLIPRDKRDAERQERASANLRATINNPGGAVVADIASTARGVAKLPTVPVKAAKWAGDAMLDGMARTAEAMAGVPAYTLGESRNATVQAAEEDQKNGLSTTQAIFKNVGEVAVDVVAAEATGKMMEAPSTPSRNYARPSNTPKAAPVATSLDELKDSYRSGKITADEFAEQHLELTREEYGGAGMAASAESSLPKAGKKQAFARAAEQASGEPVPEPDEGLWSERQARFSGDGPYTHLPEKGTVKPYKKYTSSQREPILDENERQHGGDLVSDRSGKVIPSRDRAHIDHYKARAKGGENSNANARVLLDEENLEKSDKEPDY